MLILTNTFFEDFSITDAEHMIFPLQKTTEHQQINVWVQGLLSVP